MPRKQIGGTQIGGYAELYDRLTKEVDISKMTPEDLQDYLTNKGEYKLTSGIKSISEFLSLALSTEREIEEIEDIGELRDLKKTVKEVVPTHQEQLNQKIEERIIAVSFALAENFAVQRKISLTDKIKGNVEKWKGDKSVVTIRKKGKFVAWKRL